MGKGIDRRNVKEQEYLGWLESNMPSIVLKGFYTSIKTRVLHECINCGNVWNAEPRNIKRAKSPCPACRVDTRSLGLQKYSKMVADKYPHIRVTGNTYVNNISKLNHLCLVCGHVWVSTPKSIMRGRGCLKCAQEARKKPEEYNKLLLTLNFELLEAYQSSNIKILHKHTVCGHEWLVKPNHIKNGNRCPNCRINKPITTEEYLNSLVGTEYKLLGIYGRSDTPTKHLHTTCGYEWLVRPKDLKRGHGCPKCASHGFDSSKSALLYYIKLNDSFYKIGITNRTVLERYSSEGVEVKVIKILKYPSGALAKVAERRIIKDHESVLNTKDIPTLMRYTKNTEVANYDFLGWDND